MTGLFTNQHQSSLTSTIQLIEQSLRGLGQDPDGCRLEPRGDDEAAWQFRHGSAQTRIQLTRAAGDATHSLRVAAIVMTLAPEVDRLALYGHLLQQNRQLRGLTLALDEERVELAAERPCRDLDRSEIDDLLLRVSRRADELDDLLVARFGGYRGTHTAP
ncbi:MAG: YbjN domain-containing protein [Kofleriaceae bacterium]